MTIFVLYMLSQKYISVLLLFFLSATILSAQERNNNQYWATAGIGSGTYFLHGTLNGHYKWNEHIFGMNMCAGYTPNISNKSHSDEVGNIALTYGRDLVYGQTSFQLSAGPALVMGQKQINIDGVISDKNAGFKTAGLFLALNLPMYQKSNFAFGISIQSNINSESSYLALLFTGTYGKIKQ